MDTPVQQNAAGFIVGYCGNCKKPIAQNEKYEVVTGVHGGIQKILCKDCYAERQKRQTAEQYRKRASAFRKSMIWAGIAAALITVISVVLAIVLKRPVFLAGLAVAAGMFMFISQCFWTSYSLDLLLFFCKSFHLPGLIFSLDLDGIIWLVTVKLVGSVLCALLSAAVFCAGLAVCMVVAFFTFPFCLTRETRELKRLKNVVEQNSQ